MRNSAQARRAVCYAKKFFGVPYYYGDDEFGGDDPIRGMDCSGIISEALRGVGVLDDDERLSSKMFFDRWGVSYAVKKVKPGVLILYGGAGERIYHIAMAINKHSIIESGGGNRQTKDRDTAAIRNAFVRKRPITHRKDEIVIMVDPFRR